MVKITNLTVNHNHFPVLQLFTCLLTALGSSRLLTLMVKVKDKSVVVFSTRGRSCSLDPGQTLDN